MALEVVHPEYRDVQCKTKSSRNTGSDQQGACQSRPLSVGDGIEIFEIDSSRGQVLLDQRNHAPYVVAGRQLGHYSSIFAMHFGLRVQRVAQQTSLTVIDSDAGFIAGGFNTENEQWRWDKKRFEIKKRFLGRKLGICYSIIIGFFMLCACFLFFIHACFKGTELVRDSSGSINYKTTMRIDYTY